MSLAEAMVLVKKIAFTNPFITCECASVYLRVAEAENSEAEIASLNKMD